MHLPYNNPPTPRVRSGSLSILHCQGKLKQSKIMQFSRVTKKAVKIGAECEFPDFLAPWFIRNPVIWNNDKLLHFTTLWVFLGRFTFDKFTFVPHKYYMWLMLLALQVSSVYTSSFKLGDRGLGEILALTQKLWCVLSKGWNSSLRNLEMMTKNTPQASQYLSS